MMQVAPNLKATQTMPGSSPAAPRANDDARRSRAARLDSDLAGACGDEGKTRSPALSSVSTMASPILGAALPPPLEEDSGSGADTDSEPFYSLTVLEDSGDRQEPTAEEDQRWHLVGQRLAVVFRTAAAEMYA